jgi:hypothetical protein
MAAQADFEAIDFPCANRLTIRQFGGWPYLSSIARVVWAPQSTRCLRFKNGVATPLPSSLPAGWLAFTGRVVERFDRWIKAGDDSNRL